MLGAIAGDIIESAYEFAGRKDYDFELFTEGCRFTDDTVMTFAVAQWLYRYDAEGHDEEQLVRCIKELGLAYPYVQDMGVCFMRGYGEKRRMLIIVMALVRQCGSVRLVCMLIRLTKLWNLPGYLRTCRIHILRV